MSSDDTTATEVRYFVAAGNAKFIKPLEDSVSCTFPVKSVAVDMDVREISAVKH